MLSIFIGAFSVMMFCFSLLAGVDESTESIGLLCYMSSLIFLHSVQFFLINSRFRSIYYGSDVMQGTGDTKANKVRSFTEAACIIDK